MIRELQLDDIKTIIPMFKAFYDEMNFALWGISFDLVTVLNKAVEAIQSETIHAIAYETKGNILGIGVVEIVPAIFNENEHVAIERVWHSLPNLSPFKRAKIMVKLIMAMEGWIKSRGNMLFYVYTSPHGDAKASGKYLIKNGYFLRELSFSKEI